MTLQFAPVAPLSVHRQLEKEVALGYYNLLIASEVLKDPAGYTAFWQKRPGTVILDNGIIELGYPLELRYLAEAAGHVNAAMIILPDTIDDANMTRKQVRSSNAAWKKSGYTTKTMGVVQGTTFAECVDCADSHMQAGVNFLAVPRGLTPNLGSRHDLVQHIAAEYPTTQIHLLGFSENIHDDIESVRASGQVMGIDSATPVWLGLAGRRGRLGPIPKHSANYGRRPEWFWTAGDQYGDSLETIVHNVKQVEAWLSGNEKQRNSALVRPAVKTALT